MPTPDGQPTPAEQAGQYHALAKQAFDRLEGVLGQLDSTLDALTDPEALAGVGNLDHYRAEARARIAELRQALAGLESWQGGLAGFLTERGVDADIWPPRHRPEHPQSRSQEPEPADHAARAPR